MPGRGGEGSVEDQWTLVADDAAVPNTGPIVVSLKRWLAERDVLSGRGAPVGVAVDAGASAQEHLSDLASRPFVSLGFAKFADGRAFSYARLLRDRFGFKGEMRASGDVLIDEISFMLRCGFDFSSSAMSRPSERWKLAACRDRPYTISRRAPQVR